MNEIQRYQELKREKAQLKDKIFEIGEEISEIETAYIIANALPQTKWRVKDDAFSCENIEVLHEALNTLNGSVGYYGGKLLYLRDGEDEYQIHLGAAEPIYCFTDKFIAFLKKHKAQVRLDVDELKQKVKELKLLIKAASV